ncbi:MAG: rod shape-determining protein MreC [Rickettsiales bacterium]|nr:rod shape-determining protein MreC [Rickettsiales bacterium]
MPIKKARTTSLLLTADKQWLHRASILLLITAGITLLVMSKANNPAVTRLRTHITDVAVPVLSFAASPMDAIHNAGMWVGEMVNLRSENVALKNANAELLQWQEKAKTMEMENIALRKLMQVVPSTKSSYITARIVSDLGGPYVHSALIDGGSENGIRKDQAVISDSGLIGRVVDVGESSARVLLLNDINSRVPVITETTHEKSILIGTNTDRPTLAYLTADHKITIGERVVTSGDGGIFPAGIPVGVVTSIHSNTIGVQPFVDAATPHYVSVVDHQF